MVRITFKFSSSSEYLLYSGTSYYLLKLKIKLDLSNLSC
ncbi:hypothetical protein pp309_000008 [Proteus phage 309]|uniref:Uncharacterized protein n=1 Tax=Proteus phage 309 TaxID=2894355 RepID=A0AAE9C7Y7_9CAUD|nr:hypothetical protein pp309_000008 [Proteus phage 309]